MFIFVILHEQLFTWVMHMKIYTYMNQKNNYVLTFLSIYLFVIDNLWNGGTDFDSTLTVA